MTLENTAVLNVRISGHLKQQLEELAKEKDETVSDYVREMLETAVSQGGDYISGIPEAEMKQIEAEAKRRNIPTRQLITMLLSAGFGRLRKNTSPNVFVLD